MSIAYNRVILAGNTTRDPEVRFLSSGMAVTKFGLAVNNKRKSGDTMIDEVLFIDCTAFGRTAETIGEYVKKGYAVLIEGRLQFQQWEDKSSGSKRSKHEVLIDRIQFLQRLKSSSSETEDSQVSDANEDVPF